MVAIYHVVPVAHIIAMGVQFSIYSLQNMGYNKNLCIVLGTVAHEITEVLMNLVFARIERFFSGYVCFESDKGLFADLTFGKFVMKATSSFTLTKAVDLLLPESKLSALGLSDNTAAIIQVSLSGLAGVIGTEIPEWIDG